MNCRDQDKHIISLRHTFEAGSPAVVEMQMKNSAVIHAEWYFWII